MVKPFAKTFVARVRNGIARFVVERTEYVQPATLDQVITIPPNGLEIVWPDSLNTEFGSWGSVPVLVNAVVADTIGKRFLNTNVFSRHCGIASSQNPD